MKLIFGTTSKRKIDDLQNIVNAMRKSLKKLKEDMI